MKKNKFIVKFQDLPERENNKDEKDHENVLKNIAGKKGEKCERNCDCNFGLICDSGICTDEW